MFVAGPAGYLIVVKILFQISFFYLFLSYQCVDDKQGFETLNSELQVPVAM